jgi:sortase A
VIKSVLRFVASVLMVSGALMLADAGATLLWQEPVSAYMAGRQQNDLEQAFAAPPARQERPTRGRPPKSKPLPGEAVAQIRFPSLNRKYYVIEGTGTTDLRKGPGHYPDTALPGQSRTMAIAGHRTTYGAPFRTIDKLKPGDEIRMRMRYGTYVYRVQKTRIVAPTETSVTKNVGYDRLVLTACHPLYSAAERIVVFAKLVRRP